jgi:hypothetical protein
VAMEQFTGLDSLYKHLEEKALDYKFPNQIADLFRNLRDLKHKEKKTDEVEMAQWEIDFFSFMLEGGEARSMFTGTNEKGEVIEYPTMSRFDEKAYDYLVGRLNKTRNPLLKARYSHILWATPKKHARYAQSAVDSYLELIRIYEKMDREKPEEHFGLDVLKSMKNAYALAYQVNYNKKKIKSELRRLVLKFNFDSSSFFALRANLIELMLSGKKRFKKDDFEGFGNICLKTSRLLTQKGKLHGTITMLELGEKIDLKLGVTSYDWRRKIAESYEAMTEEAAKRDNLSSMTFCQFALDNYKKIKDQKKIKELEKKYSELKKSMKLAEIKKPVDLSEHFKKCEEIAEKVAQEDSEKILKLLMLDKALLPKYSDMERIAIEHSKKFVFQHLAPTEVMDRSGHPAEHFSTDEEKKYYGILQQYAFELGLNKMVLINEIFLAAIRNRKLSSDILLQFLNRYSWFGKNISKQLPNGETIEYNWLNLIAPAINEYFRQMDYYLCDHANIPNVVLSVDSLTLKMEGLLRDICQFSGVSTVHFTKDDKGRNIAREKDIHVLLYEEPIQQLFDEDDLLFFKFLLVEKAGYNLRHKVAHSLMLFQDYNLNYMHLLILALLKLGKYDFFEKVNSTSNGSKEKI